MSYGFPLGACQAHIAATQRAFGRGVVLVAAAGNEYQEGNDPISPAADPHVLSVAAVDEQLRSADFSNENQGIALSAPGVRLLTSVIPSDDRDGIPDGYDRVSGTSFSSPIAGALASGCARAGPACATTRSPRCSRPPRAISARVAGTGRSGGGSSTCAARCARPTPARDMPRAQRRHRVGRRQRVPRRPAAAARHPRRASARGTLDEWEDPADVYRIEIPARRRVEIQLSPRASDSDLYIYGTKAPRSPPRTFLLGSSVRGGTARDRVIVRNRGRTVSGRTSRSCSPAARARPRAAYSLSLRRL